MIVPKDVIVEMDGLTETVMFWDIPSVGDTVSLYAHEFKVVKVLHTALISFADRYTPVTITLEKVL